MDKVVGGCHRVQPFDLRWLRKPSNPGMNPQNGDEPLAHPNAHSEDEFRVHTPESRGLPWGSVNLPGQSGQPRPPHSRPSSTAAVVIGLPAETTATARIRNSAEKGPDIDKALKESLRQQTIWGNQTMGQDTNHGARQRVN
ncbi:hypothetical protein GCM10007382_00050 [Salinibacterium xinjiangense]|nr:hypothetical protein GCM10007382_00050 [Salinibacterium xinjiangense]